MRTNKLTPEQMAQAQNRELKPLVVALRDGTASDAVPATTLACDGRLGRRQPGA